MITRLRCAAFVLACALPLLGLSTTAYAEDATDPAAPGGTASATPASAPTAAPSPTAQPSATPTPASDPPPSAEATPTAPAATPTAPSTAPEDAVGASTDPTPTTGPSAPAPSADPAPSSGPTGSSDPTASSPEPTTPIPSPTGTSASPTSGVSAAAAALAVVADQTTVTFDPVGCATVEAPAVAILAVTNGTADEISYTYEVSGPDGVVEAGTLVIPAGSSDSTVPEGLVAGTYTVTVTPGDAASLVDTVEVPACPPATAVDLALVDPGCAPSIAGTTFAATGTATVTNQTDAVISYDVRVTGPGVDLGEDALVPGRQSAGFELTDLPAGSYTLTVTTSDLDGNVIGTFTDTATVVQCVVVVEAIVEISTCFDTYVYAYDGGNVPVTVDLVGSSSPTGTEGDRLNRFTLDPQTDDESGTQSTKAYRYLKVVVTAPDGSSGVVASEAFDERCQLAPQRITASARCGVASFTNPADNGQVVVTVFDFSAVDETGDLDDLDDVVTRSATLPPGSTRTVMTEDDYVLWLSSLAPIRITDLDDPFVFDVGVVRDAQKGCPTPPVRPAQPVNPARPVAAGALANTGAPDDGGLVGLGLLAVASGAALLIRNRRRS